MTGGDGERRNALTPRNADLTTDDGADSALSGQIERLFDIEQRRIESQDRRWNVLSQVIEATDTSDKRQHELGLKQLESNERIEKARLALASKVAIGVGGLVVVTLAVILSMIFFGSNAQADTAKQLIAWIFTALGGGGLIFVVRHWVRWLVTAR